MAQKYWVAIRCTNGLDVSGNQTLDKGEALSFARRLNGIGIGFKQRPLSHNFMAVVLDRNRGEVFGETVHPELKDRIEAELPEDIKDSAYRYLVGAVFWHELEKQIGPDMMLKIVNIQYNLPTDV